MLVRVNGVIKEVPKGITVAAILQDMFVSPQGVAVAVNRAVVPQPLHKQSALEPEDTVEIIQAVGGG